MSNTVNEKSPLFMTVSFKDEVGDPLVPTTVEWRLDDLETTQEVVGWTNLPGPTADMNVTIPASNHVIINDGSVREERVFGVRINVGLGAEAHQEFRYHVLNLFAPSGPV